MSDGEKSARDKKAKTLNTRRLRPIKGDTEKEMKYRVATYLILKNRKRRQEKKKKS